MVSINTRYPQNDHFVLAKSLIKDCQETQNPYLDLGNCGITDLNELPELFKCEHIETLVLSSYWRNFTVGNINVSSNTGKCNTIIINNDIVSVISFLEKLTGLQSLYLSNTQISNISCLKKLIGLQSLDLSCNNIFNINCLKKLTGLQSLDLSSNKISDIRSLEKLTGLQSLYLNNTKISDIRSLEKLTGLQSLCLSHTKISDICSLERLTGLQSLYLSNTQISDISSLEKLTGLQSLYLSNNQISDIDSLGKLTGLQSLDLSHTKISDISSLGKLTGLQSLNLRNTKISDISSLERLTGLQSLYLSNNQISDISSLEKLTGLQSLDLSNIEISDISSLGKLTSLQSLYFSNTQISDISSLEKLTGLQSLYLRDNKISDISSLGKLAGLQSLDLSNIEISDISSLGKLTGLQSLYLSNNQISDISSLGKLTGLQSLCLRNNQLNKIPEFVFHIRNAVNLAGNPINKPPLEIINQGNQAVLDWFAATREKLNEIKIILIGEPKAGKTSLLKKLKGLRFNKNEKQTDGVNIEDIAFGKCATFKEQASIHDITGHFWDFGGQEIMNATHQLFLTRRSIYVLVLDARKDANNPEQIRTWLQRVKTTGGKSPVIVLANQIDEHRGFGFENQRELQDEFKLKEEDFIKISCKTDENIDMLKKRLAEVIPTAELFQTEIDERWIAIKNRLQKETKKKYFLNEHRFTEICKEENLTEKDGQRNAISFFHDLGFVLHFKDLSQDLAEYYVLNPYWITYGTYQVLTSEHASKNKGIVTKDDLEFIINDEKDKKSTYRPMNYEKIIYSPSERFFLMNILCKFKLCFHVPSLKIYIIPDLLGTTEPLVTNEIRQAEKNIQFEYVYDTYLPKSVMPNIMAEMHHAINIEHMWRTGCVVQNGNCKALVTSYKNRIKIIVIGEYKQKREFLAIIRSVIDKINEKLSGNINRVIPLPGTDNMYVDYNELLEMEKDGKFFYTIYKPSKREFEISKLLDGIPREEEVISIGKEALEEMFKRQTKIFKKKNKRQTKEIISTTKDIIRDVLIEIQEMDMKQKNKAFVEIMAKIEDTFKIFSDKINEENKERFDKLKRTDDWQARLRLSIPLLDSLGVNLGVEFDLKAWAKRAYDKFGFEIFKILGDI